MDPIELLLNRITERTPGDRAALRQLKRAVAAESRTGLIRNDALLARYRADVTAGRRIASAAVERVLTLNQIRSESGIATVTVITEPFACPGRCVYCPTEARAPKSYLVNEPAVMRAIRNDYDPFRQVTARLEALRDTGHPTDKIELIVKGGTWSFYPEAYQQRFIHQCLEAANAFGQPASAPAANVQDAERMNERAASRMIGITIETRPDYVDEAEVRRLRALGVTRVELGVQTLEESVLELIVRDHGALQVRLATALLKDAGIKVAYHIMPNLPGATPDSDFAAFQELFSSPDYQPDTLKLYPCVVVESAELHDWWQQGRYQPYDDETLVELLIRMKQAVPPHVRIERVIRDIPSTSIRAGCLLTNLREEAQKRMAARGIACRCIRCRQVREDGGGAFTLVTRTYDASGGVEIFLSFEDAARERLASLLRLRIPAPARRGAPHWLPALEGAGLIRELHTYGQHLPLHRHDADAAQHRGFGMQLMEEAERIAKDDFGLARMAVIAGAGVRAYYRKLGYDLLDTYMVKALR